VKILLWPSLELLFEFGIKFSSFAVTFMFGITLALAICLLALTHFQCSKCLTDALPITIAQECL